MKSALMLVLFSPLLGAFLNGLRWKNQNLKAAYLIGLSSCLLSFLGAVVLFVSFFKTGAVPPILLLEWFNIGGLSASFSFLLDPLSLLMILLITGVAVLVHVFSLYYMSQDLRPAKYFSYLNLFVFSMLVLVLADNLLLMFLGWEGVGLCSYLLIGFWFTKKEKALSGMKAFIVNRIGDMGFLLGMFLLFKEFSSLDFSVLSQVGGGLNLKTIKWACFFLFLGAVGKSAQIPLYVWLPSAMAGPTPVSALIHAATMVTAGVYLIVRLSALFSLSPELLNLIAWTGALTAFFAALMACAQRDIKKVLAYSTVSQLGYMFTALGVGAFTAGMFHLTTHAFFKALLFLSAGAVICALKGEQNIYRMGGLKKSLPVTYICFTAGVLALIGLPPFAGFFSKDEILWSAFVSKHFGLFALSAFTALISAFYMSRLFALVFLGQARFSSTLKPRAKGFSALFPLMVLALLSLFGGLLGLPHVIEKISPFHPPHFIEAYLKPVVAYTPFKGSYQTELFLMGASSLICLLVFVLTLKCYLKPFSFFKSFKEKNHKAFSFVEEGFRIDAFYHNKITRPVLKISYELWQGMDLKLIGGFIVLIQKWLISLKSLLESAQNGKMPHYVLFILTGLIVCMLSVLLN